MSEKFLGYHSEWNLGSPGGWDYQRMAQEVAKIGWKRIKEKSGLKIELDFEDPILNPVPNFAQMLLRAHKRYSPGNPAFIALIAEEDTLDKVGENIRIVQYLNEMPDVSAVLVDPAKLELRDGEVYVQNQKVTTVFMDFNNKVIVKLKKEHKLEGLLGAIEKGLVTNPRGMEPVGAKGVFEAVTGEFKDKMAQTTLERTPWTRQFYPRSTVGPEGEEIPDLIKWARDNWDNIILKPVHGYSGHGIIIGHKEEDIEKSIKRALDAGDYIIQPLVPLAIWAEDFPWIDKDNKKLFIKRWQTDFRCFITDVGLIGFVTRFGGIPTNVGSGGGIQSTAILRSGMPLDEAIKKVNEAILGLGFDFIWQLQQELDKVSIEMGNVYLLGPIMCTLRPRIITPAHIEQLKEYAHNLWNDALTLEKLWLDGKLEKFVQINKEEEAIAKLAPWQGRPALIAADGLFGFGEKDEDR
ncbi:MAG: hypothetical protein JW869_08765 [Candidatus Omnitrophica bacterium]|nr:hypothetical protein [Candidatus Omnitrophota bacterium]